MGLFDIIGDAYNLVRNTYVSVRKAAQSVLYGVGDACESLLGKGNIISHALRFTGKYIDVGFLAYTFIAPTHYLWKLVSCYAVAEDRFLSPARESAAPKDKPQAQHQEAPQGQAVSIDDIVNAVAAKLQAQQKPAKA